MAIKVFGSCRHVIRIVMEDFTSGHNMNRDVSLCGV